MPDPKPPAKGKKLPLWAYIAAAGIGLLFAFFILRKPSGGSESTTIGTTAAPPDQTDNIYNILSALTAALAAHPQAVDSGDGTGGTNPAPTAGYPSGAKCKSHIADPRCPAPVGTAQNGATFACSNCASGQCKYVEGGADTCI